MYWGQWGPQHDRWTGNIRTFLLAIVVQQFSILLVLFIIEGVADSDAIQSEGLTDTPTGSTVCIGIYLAMLILSLHYWTYFRRRPYLKTAFGGCAVGYYAPVLWSVLSAPIWLVPAYLVVPGAATVYLWIYVAKAERVVPMGPARQGDRYHRSIPPPPLR